MMQNYFKKVIFAEREVFGDISFLPDNVRILPLRSGDLNFFTIDILGPALESDFIIVFGASYIKPPLVDILIEKGAINIHMGVSPYYRGAACNFWALYDGNADLVGATIHKLAHGLDNGGILFHALPKPIATDPFLLGMKAARAAHKGLAKFIREGTVNQFRAEKQIGSDEIRCTRNKDFSDNIATEYLDRNLKSEDVGKMLDSAPSRVFQLPYFDD